MYCVKLSVLMTALSLSGMAALSAVVLPPNYLQRINAQASPTPVANSLFDPCENPETKAFDFQIGIWQSEDGKQVHEIKKTLDGCAIKETWKTDGIDSAHAFKSFDNGNHSKTGEKKWFYSWFAKGFHQHWEGRKENGQWRFYREWWLDRKAVLSRTYWSKLPDGNLDRIVEQSRDGGKTWLLHVKHRFAKINRYERITK